MAKKFENSSSIEKNLDDVLVEIDNLKKCGAIERVSKEEALSEGSICSPILWVSQPKPDGSTKTRLIHHDLLNYSYTKPKFSLSKITVELERLADFNILRKCDKEKCYYQFILREENSKTLRFSIKVKNEILYFQWKCMAMGMSAAPYVAQSTNNFLSDLYSLKFRVYHAVYLDDFWGEPKPGVPKFEKWAGEFGLRFKTTKSEEGSILELLGVEINLITKTAKITSDKAQKIEKDARLFLANGHVNSKQLAIFYGRLEFASQMCQIGRVQTRAITKQMGSTLIVYNGLSETDKIILSPESIKEIEFWSSISDHAPLHIGKRSFVNGNVLASDACGKKYAYVIGPKSFADNYPDHIKDEHINVKESFALNQLVKKAIRPETDFEILCDNETTVRSFNKGRSNNVIIHELVKEVKELLAERNSRLRVVWICTKKMEQYADGPSRGVYVKAEFGLTEQGIKRIIDLFPSFEYRRNNTDLVSLFAGPLNNPAHVRYFALDIDNTDHLSAGKDAFQAISERKLAGGRMAGGFLAYPPISLINSFNRVVKEIGLDEDSEIYYIIPSTYVSKVVKFLSGTGNITVRSFCGKSNSKILYKRPSVSMAIVNIKSFDLECRGEGKKVCLRV